MNPHAIHPLVPNFDLTKLGVPDAVQRESGAPLIRDRYEPGPLERSRVCGASLRTALRPGNSFLPSTAAP
jgi:hypothetical protein